MKFDTNVSYCIKLYEQTLYLPLRLLLRFKSMADYTGRKEEPSFSGRAMPSRWEISETVEREKIVEVVGKAPFTVLERDYSLGRARERHVSRPPCDEVKSEGICLNAPRKDRNNSPSLL